MSSQAVRHPIFARVYKQIAAAAEKAGAAEHRDQLLAGLNGRVVEVGAGTGLNFAHYPTSVTEVVAVEPESLMRREATKAAAGAPVRVVVLDGDAERLPLDDASVDSGVVSLVLCSVPDQAPALAELRRVIRPGGELRFYEHVIDSDRRVRHWQQRVEPIWSRLGGGCHLTRDTASAISAAGFEIETCDEFLFPPGRVARLAAHHILGRARRS